MPRWLCAREVPQVSWLHSPKRANSQGAHHIATSTRKCSAIAGEEAEVKKRARCGQPACSSCAGLSWQHPEVWLLRVATACTISGTVSRALKPNPFPPDACIYGRGPAFKCARWLWQGCRTAAGMPSLLAALSQFHLHKTLAKTAPNASLAPHSDLCWLHASHAAAFASACWLTLAAQSGMVTVAIEVSSLASADHDHRKLHQACRQLQAQALL